MNAPFQTANTTSYSSTRWTKYLGSTTSSYKDPAATNSDALKTVLDPEDDAAHVNWGGSWRMPTKAELYELRTNCTWTWTTINGIKGYKVQSNKSGYTDRWIFLPAAGCRSGTFLRSVGSYGLYWSSSLNTDDPSGAYRFGAIFSFFQTYNKTLMAKLQDILGSPENQCMAVNTVRTKRSDRNTFLWTIGRKAMLQARFHPYHMGCMAE